MHAAPRWFLCAVAAPALLLAACSARPEWSARVGLDFWAIPEMGRQIQQERRDLARADEALHRCGQRLESREHVIDDLCRGRIGLLEAAGHFRDLSAGSAAAGEVRSTFSGGTDDERYCRQVIQWVHARVPSDASGEAARLEATLDGELRGHLRRDGGVRLP